MMDPFPRPRLVVAFCTYNRVERLAGLVEALRAQACDEPFELLAVDNNSADRTPEVLQALAAAPGPRLRVATETRQGIVAARNRLVEEAAWAEYLLMMDDDEMPEPGWVQAGLSALRDGALDCVGGKVRVTFEPHGRPAWLADELLGFLAEVDHGERAFPVTSHATPIWTANVGYRNALFRDGLRFDARYSRIGKGVGGGEDVVMFETLLARNARMGYRPDMVVQHFVEPWRLKRRYFLRLHYASGVRAGMYAAAVSGRHLFGAPLFLFRQAIEQGWRTVRAAAAGGQQGWIRQGMNFTNACGRLVGALRRDRVRSPLSSSSP